MNQKKSAERDVFVCPVGKFFSELCGAKPSKFREHLSRSRVEFLKAIRSLVDERIDALEKRREETCERATKIEVE